MDPFAMIYEEYPVCTLIYWHQQFTDAAYFILLVDGTLITLNYRDLILLITLINLCIGLPYTVSSVAFILAF